MTMLRYHQITVSACEATEKRRLQKVNSRARVIRGRRKRDHTSDVLAAMKWLSAENLILNHKISGVRRIVRTGHPSVIAETLVSTVNDGHDTIPATLVESGCRE